MTMRVFYDTEFLEDGFSIDLISIGIYLESGEEYYAVSNEFNGARVLQHPWLMRNVMNSISHEIGTWNNAPYRVIVTDKAAKSRAEIRNDIIELLLPHVREGIELWAWYGAYDHVALAQLWGRMIDMPSQIVPMYTNDIMTLSALKGHPELPRQISGAHNALSDAKHNKVMYDFLRAL